MKLDFNLWGHPEEQKEIDFASIKSICNNNIQSILEHYQPGGRIVQGEYVCATKFGGQGSSCSTSISKGAGGDFGAGETWGDMIDLVAQIEDVSMSEAARRLQSFLSCGGELRPTPSIPQQSPQERYEAGQRIAIGLWVESEACPIQHPYLLKKQINPDSGIRVHPGTGNILIPLYDEHGTLWSVERISPDGEKKGSHCGKKFGNFYIIQGERDIIYICEGYATGQTVAMITGKTVVCAFAAGNITAVSDKISAMFPAAHLVFAADNDQKLDSNDNPGVKAAMAAAKQIGRGSVIIPPFPADQKGDWNDYAIQHGLKAARELLMSSKRSQVFVDIKTLVLAEPQFIVEDILETPCTGMVFGPSGGGKSFFVLDMGFHIACGKKWLGKTVKQGAVFYVCGEGRHAIPRRMKAWETYHKAEVPFGKFMMSSARVDFSPESVRDMISEIDQLDAQTGAPAIIMIDTMARALPGDSDENSSKDVGTFIDECDRLQQKYNCVVLIVHHTGHANEANKRARGSSAIKGAMDIEILVTKERTVEWTKTKDMEPHPPIKFELQPVQYGEGKRDGSCVLKYDLEFNPAKSRSETAYRKAARLALAEAVAAEGIGKCMSDTWVNCFSAMFPEKTPRAIRAALLRKECGEAWKMIEAGEVDHDGKYWSPITDQKVVTETMFKGLI